MEEIRDYKLLLDTAVLAGQIMLQNGAEIYRVEDTIYRILKMSHFKTAEAYVTPTGLIVTLDDPKTDSMTVVKRIASRETNLHKITVANDISRKFCAGECTLKEAFHQLKHMDSGQYAPCFKYGSTVLAAALFSVMLGGTMKDALGAGCAGACLAAVQYVCRRLELNAFLELLCAAAAVAVSACMMVRLGAKADLGLVTIGGIMPIVPGAALTTAVRDTLQGDYVAGGAKALEAFVRASAIAIGVWFGMMIAGGGLG